MADQLEETKAKIDALRPLPADVEAKLDAAFEARYVAHSNEIEEKGAPTLVETEVFFESELTSAGRKVDDFLALARHREALAEARAKARAGAPLSLDLIRGLHLTLTRDLKDRDHGPGEWKSKANRATTRRGRAFRYAAPEAVPGLMRDLVALHEGLVARTGPVDAITTFSYHFHLIHPFNDSNGRVQRLVASFLLLKAGYRELMVDPQDKGLFLDALTGCDTTVPADKLAALYSGIDTSSLRDFYATCLERTLEETLAIIEGRTPLTTADLAKASRRDQRAFLTRMKQANPEIKWREEASAEVKALHQRVSATLQAAAEEGPLYSIEAGPADLMSDHSADPLVRASLPSGGAGVVGQSVLTIKPKSTAAVKMPKPRLLVIAVLATKVGLHVLSRWEDEAKPVVRHGQKKAAAWSQASIERHLVERVERSRRAYDAEIVELNRVKDLKAALKGITEKRKKAGGMKGVKAQEPPVEL